MDLEEKCRIQKSMREEIVKGELGLPGACDLIEKGRKAAPIGTVKQTSYGTFRKEASGWVRVKKQRGQKKTEEGKKDVDSGASKVAGMARKLISDIESANMRTKYLNQQAIGKVMDNLESGKPDLAAAKKLILDYNAKDNGKTISNTAIDNVVDEID